MAAGAGARTERVTFSRQAEGQDEHGEDVAGWTEFGSAKAEVFWGSGNERREAARTGGSQAASFVVLATARTRGVTIQNRIRYAGADWDIKGIVQRGRREIEFEAVRAV